MGKSGDYCGKWLKSERGKPGPGDILTCSCYAEWSQVPLDQAESGWRHPTCRTDQGRTLGSAEINAFRTGIQTRGSSASGESWPSLAIGSLSTGKAQPRSPMNSVGQLAQARGVHRRRPFGGQQREQVPHHARAAQHELHEAVLVVPRRVHRRAVPCLAYPPGTIGLRKQPQ